MDSKKVVFSGIQPTGNIHLGNYLGAVKNWVDMQDMYDNIFCIVNSHAITIKQNPKELIQKTLDLACILIACGIDPKKSNLFIQSKIDYHPALAWILDCNIFMGDMTRMTQFKDKSNKNPKNINVGLFNYPALMAADILLYQVDLVPVGSDQKQHIELTRNVAMKFNRDFGECFKIPEPLILKEGARVMGLDDPTTKMSKSATGKNHAIFLLDEPDVIISKIKKATTDSNSNIVFDENRAGVYNLLCIYEVLSKKNRASIEDEFANKGYGVFKNALAEIIIDTLRPIQTKYRELNNDKKYIQEILQNGLDSVLPRAESTYNKAKELIGLL
ncbi:tryptophan--tRNA ligase [Helicobacter sp. MIT 99-5507]|uniref:tryptophan--tRNA ligase n=1 Tax=Helicobacter sp. MIT 99-5507 TaxID=152489 RepID=UPI000E1F2164|nr:tryptophan--tRNA ligase [Helicobacter sp. MIT 99-5507]RDU56692.1 tryptophan--tRNA ligase [Helicobacter sp. MIT 99-5507]